MNYWLMKSEPDVFSFQDLKKKKEQGEPWNGVRNYQARNFMRDEMKKGDLVIFYHSNASPSHIAGIAEVSRESYPDETALDPKSEYYDSKSSLENPRWFMVDVKFKEDLPRVLSLDELRKYPELKNMKLLMKGQRLSIMPITEKEFNFIKIISSKK